MIIRIKTILDLYYLAVAEDASDNLVVQGYLGR
mgnify:CR=1 FL=1